MASGTSYTIYRTSMNAERVNYNVTSVLRSYARQHGFGPLGDDVEKETRFGWDDVPEVFPYSWNSFNENKEPEDESDFDPFAKFIRKSDGAVMERISCWDFISTSTFLMTDVFACDTRRDVQITPYMATQFIQAVDFAEMYPMFKKSGSALIGKMSETNDYIASLNRLGLIPVSTFRVLDDETEQDERDIFVRRVRAIMVTFTTLLTSSETDSYVKNKVEYVLMLSHW